MTTVRDELHPLLLQSYALYTAPIDEMCKQVERWVDARITGAYIYGLSRIGKSKAVRDWFPALLRESYGDRLAVFRLIYAQQNQSSQLSFLKRIAHGINHNHIKASGASDLEWRIASYFIVRGLKATLRQVVLFVDEAQYMTEIEFHTLCNLQNLVEDAGVRLSVIAVGTHQIQQQSQTFILAHNAHLSARFLAHRARFRGIRSAGELRYVLNGYDETTDWPEGSGTSYTKYFFPGAYENGFRLANCTGILWDIYYDLAPPTLRNKLEVPMGYIATPMEILCKNHAAEHESLDLDKSLLTKVVRMTNYVTMMREIVGAHLIDQAEDS